MIAVPSGARIWLAAGVTDLRRGFDGLAALVQNQLLENPFDGQVFLFRGRRGDLLKVLWHDDIADNHELIISPNLLIQRGLAITAGRNCRRRAHAHNRICEGAEIAHAALVRSDWRSDDLIRPVRGAGRAAERERVTALATASQLRIDQAGASGTRGSATRAAQRRQGAGKAGRRIAGVVSNLSRIDGTNRRHRGRFVGRDARAQQVRDRDRCDDQNDRNHDQQFDERETLLFAHYSPLFSGVKNSRLRGLNPGLWYSSPGKSCRYGFKKPVWVFEE